MNADTLLLDRQEVEGLNAQAILHHLNRVHSPAEIAALVQTTLPPYQARVIILNHNANDPDLPPHHSISVELGTGVEPITLDVLAQTWEFLSLGRDESIEAVTDVFTERYTSPELMGRV